MRSAALPLSLFRRLVRRSGKHPAAIEGFDDYKRPSRRASRADRRAAQDFLLSSATDHDRFAMLFRYFAEGAARHVDARGSRIFYRGYTHKFGRKISGLEGFARVAPLFAAWLASGRGPDIRMHDGSTLDLVTFLRTAFLEGTDRNSDGFWGEIGDGDQRIVEAADIARAVWLSRELVWRDLDSDQRQQIATWLSRATQVSVGNEGNWNLCAIITSAFLNSLGVQVDFRSDLYNSFKERCERQMGWFSDGPEGPVDFYNCWAMSFELFWLRQSRPDFDGAFIEGVLAKSSELTKHLISPKGIPIMGRSLCYRTAVPSPMIAAALLTPPVQEPGQARRALDLVWRYFIERGALQDGGLTLGYFGNDARLVDAYSGAGSCHWGLRSLMLAFYAPAGHPFWTDVQQPLPIERGSFHLGFSRLGWEVEGDHVTQDIIIRILTNPETTARLDPMTMRRRIKQLLLQRPYRPSNTHSKYGLRRYSALAPLGGTITSSR